MPPSKIEPSRKWQLFDDSNLTIAIYFCAGLAGICAVFEYQYHGLDLPVTAMTTALVFSFVLAGIRGRYRSQMVEAMRMASAMLENDQVACIVATEEGQVIFSNPAARAQLGIKDTNHVTHALGMFFASAECVFRDLTDEAMRAGSAECDATLAAGRSAVRALRVSKDFLLWRFENPVSAKELGTLWGLPMMRVDGDGLIKYLNQPARQFLRGQPYAVEDVYKGDLTPGLRELATRHGRKQAVILEKPSEQGGKDMVMVPVDRPPEATKVQHSLIDNLPVAILKIGVGGKILMVNQTGRRILNLAQGEQYFQDHVEGLGRPVKEWINEVIETDHGTSSEVLRVRRDDDEVYVQVSLRRSLYAEDRTVIAVLNDATELKRLEAQFTQSQKMQAVGELAGGVAHDFNNLLTAISGHCDLLLLRRDEGHPDYGDLMQIHHNANRAAALVEQLLAFSRKQNLRPEQVNLRDTLQDLGHLLDRLVGAPIRLSVHHDNSQASIWVDRRQFEQVIMNLVVNARDAMPEGGEIQITTSVRKLVRDLQKDRAKVPAGDYIVISVQDQGQGIPEKVLDKIFDPFFTTKPQGKGTGLGLSMAYGIVKQSGGFIFVDSAEQQGTRFDLYFPMRKGHEIGQSAAVSLPAPAQSSDGIDLALAESLHRVQETRAPLQPAPHAPEPTKSQPVPEAAGSSAGVVLLVEDEASVRAFAARALTLRGYTVIEADSAEKALDVLSATTTKFDLFVTDVVMPGDDGPTWVRRARENYPDTRVVFMSGYTEEAFAENKETFPNSVFLQKPFSLSDFTKTVKQQVEKARAS